jgi:hypothetical protein
VLSGKIGADDWLTDARPAQPWLAFAIRVDSFLAGAGHRPQHSTEA